MRAEDSCIYTRFLLFSGNENTTTQESLRENEIMAKTFINVILQMCVRLRITFHLNLITLKYSLRKKETRRVSNSELNKYVLRALETKNHI